MKICPICKSKNNKLERVLNSIGLLKCNNCNFVYANLTNEYIEEVNSTYDDLASSRYETQQTIFDEVWFKKL